MNYAASFINGLAIAVDHSTVSIFNTELLNNKFGIGIPNIQVIGAGIYAQFAEINISNCTLRNNTATVTAGIWATFSSINVDQTSLESNLANDADLLFIGMNSTAIIVQSSLENPSKMSQGILCQQCTQILLRSINLTVSLDVKGVEEYHPRVVMQDVLIHSFNTEEPLITVEYSIVELSHVSLHTDSDIDNPLLEIFNGYANISDLDIRQGEILVHSTGKSVVWTGNSDFSHVKFNLEQNSAIFISGTINAHIILNQQCKLYSSGVAQLNFLQISDSVEISSVGDFQINVLKIFGGRITGNISTLGQTYVSGKFRLQYGNLFLYGNGIMEKYGQIILVGNSQIQIFGRYEFLDEFSVICESLLASVINSGVLVIPSKFKVFGSLFCTTNSLIVVNWRTTLITLGPNCAIGPMQIENFTDPILPGMSYEIIQGESLENLASEKQYSNGATFVLYKGELLILGK